MRKLLGPAPEWGQCATFDCGEHAVAETSLGYACLNHAEGADLSPGHFWANGVEYQSLGYPHGAMRWT